MKMKQCFLALSLMATLPLKTFACPEFNGHYKCYILQSDGTYSKKTSPLIFMTLKFDRNQKNDYIYGISRWGFQRPLIADGQTRVIKVKEEGTFKKTISCTQGTITETTEMMALPDGTPSGSKPWKHVIQQTSTGLLYTMDDGQRVFDCKFESAL